MSTAAASDRKSLFRDNRFWPALLFCLAIFFIYLSNGRWIASDDNLALRYLPLSIIREGNFNLDEFSFLYANHVLLYPIVHHNGHFLSFAPVGPSMLAVPFYLLPALYGISAESLWLPYLEKVAAAGIAAFSALFILLALARMVPIREALLATGLYALGTVTFGVSSQSLWPVGSAQLLLAVALYLLTRGQSDSRWIPYAALPLSWAVLSRPSTALVGLIIAMYLLHHHRRHFLAFVLMALPAVAFQLAYNTVYLDSPFLPPGYVSTGGHVLARPENFNTPLIKGLTGLLISPSVGFFVYSPVFIFALIGIYRCWRSRDPLTPYLAAAVPVIILLDSKLNMWWGGIIMGPRYLVEITPLLAYFLAFGVPSSGPLWQKTLFGILAVWSIYANGLVAYMFDGNWDNEANLWSWSNSPIVYYSRQGLDSIRALGPAVVRRIHQLPDSRFKTGLAADVQVEGLPSRLSTFSLLDLTVHVENSGDAVWLRRPWDGIGAVRFGWRWFRPDGTLEAQSEGRGAWLTADLLPGHRMRLAARVAAPAEPGLYTLELGMVSEVVAWFGRDGGPPMRVGIEVTGEPLCPFERALTSMADPTESPLHLEWVADRIVVRSNEVLAARLNISNPGPARVLYPVIVLQWPSGTYSFFDLAQQRFHDICPGWIEYSRPMFLDHGYRAVEYPILSLLPAGMPEGPYTLYFLYLRPKDGSLRLTASAALRFERVP